MLVCASRSAAARCATRRRARGNFQGETILYVPGTSPGPGRHELPIFISRTGYRNVFSVTSARAARRGNPASPGRADWTDLRRKASAFECVNPRGKRCHIAQARGAGVRARPPASFRQCRRRGRETRQPRIAWARRLNRSSKNIKCFRMRQSPWQTVPHGSSVGGGSEGTPAGGLTKLDT